MNIYQPINNDGMLFIFQIHFCTNDEITICGSGCIEFFISICFFAILGLGITIGVVVVVILLFVVRAIPKSIIFGGVEFEIPTPTTTTQSIAVTNVPPSLFPTVAIPATQSAQCSHFQVASSTQTMVTVPAGMWAVVRNCSPAKSACFYTLEQSSGGQYLSYEHNGNADRYWVNAFCTEAEAKNFANTDAKAMLEWWQFTPQNPFP